METEVLKIHNLNSFKGYPMYFTHKRTEENNIFTLANDTPVLEGELLFLDKRHYKILEIMEKRKAVGNYIGERPDFYRLRCKLVLKEEEQNSLRSFI